MVGCLESNHILAVAVMSLSSLPFCSVNGDF